MYLHDTLDTISRLLSGVCTFVRLHRSDRLIMLIRKISQNTYLYVYDRKRLNLSMISAMIDAGGNVHDKDQAAISQTAC